TLALIADLDVRRKRIARLTDDEIPCLAGRQRLLLDHASALLRPASDARLDAVHGAQPGQFANETLAHRGDDQLALGARISVAARIAVEIRLEVSARQVPETLGNVFLMAARSAMVREEPSECRGVIRDAGGVVR